MIQTLEKNLVDAKAKLVTLDTDHKAKVQELMQSDGYQIDAKLRRMTRELAEITRLMETLKTANEGQQKK